MATETAETSRPAPLRNRTWRLAGQAGAYALVFGWLWFWRTNSYTGGDSEQWVRMIHGGAWFQETQPLVFFLVQLVFRTIDAAFGGTARMAFAIVSCVSGVVAFDAVTRIYRETPSRGIRLALVFTAGFTTLFYGHLESYAAPAAALIVHLLCVKRSTEDRWPVYVIPLSYTLMVALHLVALFVFPAMLFVTIAEARRRPEARRQMGRLAAAVAAPLIAWMIIRALGTNRSGDSITYLVEVGRTLISNPAGLPEFVRPRLKLLFAFWNGGVAAILLLQAWPQRRERLVLYWSPYLALLLGFTTVWGAFRDETDFDLHSFPWIVMTLLAAWVYRPMAWSRIAVALILAVNAGLWLSRPASYADVLNRGTATLHICREALEDGRYVLLDQSLKLGRENRFVPSGTHDLSLYGKAGVVRASFDLNKGVSYRLCIEEGTSMRLSRID